MRKKAGKSATKRKKTKVMKDLPPSGVRARHVKGGFLGDLGIVAKKVVASPTPLLPPV